MKVQKLTSNRLYINEVDFYRVSPDIIYEFNLKKGIELDEKTEKKLMIELLLFRSYGILLRKDYTEKEIKQKLLMEFPKDSPFDDAIYLLKEKGYLDDYSYVKSYISFKKISKKKVYYDLMMKGIKKTLIDEVYEEFEIDEKIDIRKFLEKLDKKEEKKKIEFLLRKGYNLRDILEVLKENRKN